MDSVQLGGYVTGSVVLLIVVYRFFLGPPSFELRLVGDNLCLLATFFTVYAYVGARPEAVVPSEDDEGSEDAVEAAAVSQKDRWELLVWTVKAHLLKVDDVRPTTSARMMVVCHMLLAFFHNVLLVQRRDALTAVEAMLAKPPETDVLTPDQQRVVLRAVRDRKERLASDREARRNELAMERARRMLGPDRAYLLEEPGLHEQLELQHRVETEVLEPESGARYNPETTASVGSVAFGSANMWDGDQSRAVALTSQYLGGPAPPIQEQPSPKQAQSPKLQAQPALLQQQALPPQMASHQNQPVFMAPPYPQYAAQMPLMLQQPLSPNNPQMVVVPQTQTTGQANAHATAQATAQ